MYYQSERRIRPATDATSCAVTKFFTGTASVPDVLVTSLAPCCTVCDAEKEFCSVSSLRYYSSGCKNPQEIMDRPSACERACASWSPQQQSQIREAVVHSCVSYEDQEEQVTCHGAMP
jgi:hypothetical protein